MQWFWTDDLAVLLLEQGEVSPERVSGWMQRPAAYAAPDDAAPLETARLLLGGTTTDAA
jgi:hypothetical protein